MTPAMVRALAHFSPEDPPMLAKWYSGCPTLVTIRALVARGLLQVDSRLPPMYSLTARGAEDLRLRIAAGLVVIPDGCVRLHAYGDACGPLCYAQSLSRWDMSRRTPGFSPDDFREALAFAPIAP